jgi:hypothetical protein
MFAKNYQTRAQLACQKERCHYQIEQVSCVPPEKFMIVTAHPHSVIHLR